MNDIPSLEYDVRSRRAKYTGIAGREVVEKEMKGSFYVSKVLDPSEH